MKYLVLGEGKHDVHFVGEILSQSPHNFEVSWFIAEELENGTDHIPEQSKALRDFVWADSRNDFLLKSEEGAGGLYKIVANITDDLITGDFGYTIVADLDGGSINEVVQSIQDSLDDIFKGAIQIQPLRPVDAEPPLRTWRCRIESDTGPSDEFGMITFDIDLEDATGIKYSDTWHEKARKLKNYVSSGNVYTISRDIIEF